jgi:ABC-2 type transport system ATP-binding protein
MIKLSDGPMTSNAGGKESRPLAIEAHGLVKRFDKFTAVDGVDLAVPEGPIILQIVQCHKSTCCTPWT